MIAYVFLEFLWEGGDYFFVFFGVVAILIAD